MANNTAQPPIFFQPNPAPVMSPQTVMQTPAPMGMYAQASPVPMPTPYMMPSNFMQPMQQPMQQVAPMQPPLQALMANKKPGLFNPENRCPIDPRTHVSMGPSFLPTIIVVLFFFRLIQDAARYFSISRNVSGPQKIIVYATIVVQCVSFYIYVLFYQKCNAWKGWFIFIGTAIATDLLLLNLISNQIRENEQQQQQQH